MQSSLTATGREHACPDEPLILVCKVNGQYIQWTFNSYYRTTFFHDGNVNEVQTVSGQYGVRAILTGNDPIPNSPNAGFKHLTSSLIIETSNSLSGYLHNVSCSSDTAMHTHQLKIAGKDKYLNCLKIAINANQVILTFSVNYLQQLCLTSLANINACRCIISS